ncbi:WG repeat-containing protein [Bernardetia sp.]|uniref:WG repeat-containing protein n=1 Tax=Bernardetia sp. TaxID=1937974 RepID=UPI0025B91A88|nr:WG repeat-containing protein [Bernardetia sp.]
MRFLLLSILLFSFSLPSFSQEITRLPVRKDGKWGIIDQNSKKIIPLEYDFAEVADFNYLLLKKNGKWIATDETGKPLFSFTENVTEIRVIDSLLIAYKNEDNKYIFLSKNGNKTTEAFDRVLRIRNSYALGYKNDTKKYNLISPKADILIESIDTAYFLNSPKVKVQTNVILAKKGKEEYLPNLKDQTLSQKQLYNINLLPNGYVSFGAGRPLGVADTEGNVIVSPQYASVVALSMDYLALKAPTAEWSLFDLGSKKEITPAEYSFFEVVETEKNEIRITACKDGKCGVMDKNAKFILQPTYSQIYNLQNSLLVGKNEDNKWSILDTNGKKILSQNFELVYDFTEFSPFTKVTTQEGDGLIDKKGNLILTPIYTGIDVFIYNKNETYIFAYQNEKITAIEFDTKNGNVKEAKKTTFSSFATLPSHYAKLDKPEVFTARLAGRLSTDYRWFQNPRTKKWHLLNKQREPAFRDGFDVISVEPISGFTLGRNNVNGSLSAAALIDHKNGKLISQNKLFYAELEDFRTAEVARAYADSTKENAILTKAGLLVTQIAGTTIDSMTYFSENRLPIKAGGKWGLMDEKGQVILPPTYSYIFPFENGSAKVKTGENFGIIDKTGKAILPLEYEYIGSFENGMALMVKSKQVGVVDNKGKIIITPQYERLSLENGIIRARKNGKWGIINSQNKTLLPFEYQYISTFSENTAIIRKNNLWGFLANQNTTLKVILEPSIKADFINEVRNGIAKVSSGRYIEEDGYGNKNAYYKQNGIIKTNGNWILEQKYSFIEDEIFDLNTAQSNQLVLIEQNGKVGYADKTGKIIVAPRYDAIQDNFSEIYFAKKGISEVKNSGKIGYINHEGKEILPLEFSKVNDFYGIYNVKDAVTVAKKPNSKYGTIDRHNNTIIPFEYDFIGMDERNDTLSFVKQNKHWGVINPFGQPVVPIRYSSVKYLQKPNSQRALIEVFSDSSAVLYLDEKGNFVENANKNLVIVEQGGKFGIKTNTSAETFLVNPSYDFIEEFGKIGKTSWAKVGNKDSKNPKQMLYGIIDSKGNEILKTEYLEIGTFSEGKIAVQQNGKSKDKQLFGYVDENGKKVIDFQFYKAFPFSDGMAKVDLSRAGTKWSYINEKGEVVIKSAYTSGSDFGEGMAVGEMFLIDKTGKRVSRLPYQKVTAIGEYKNGFENGVIGLATERGFIHIKKDGSPLYQSYFDSLTQFRNGIAFVKTGEKYQLLRRSTENPDTVRLNFSATAMRNYEAKYKKNRKIKTKYGETIVDLGFEKVDNGYWLMINESGDFVSPTRYDAVSVLPTQTILYTNGVYGYADLDGNWILPPSFEARQYVQGYIIRLERAGKITYLGLDGKVIWEE